MDNFSWDFKENNFFLHNYNISLVQAIFSYGNIDSYTYSSNNIKIPLNFEDMSLKRKCEYFIGRICSKKAIELIGEKSGDLLSLTDRRVNWPTKILGSISHTTSEAISYVCLSEFYTNIGIDIENIMDKEKCDLIVRLLLDKEEIIYINNLTKIKINYEELITLIFSSKETFYKAFYKDIRFFFDFNTIRFIYINNYKVYFYIKDRKIRNILKKEKIEINYFFSRKNVYTYITCSKFNLLNSQLV